MRRSAGSHGPTRLMSDVRALRRAAPLRVAYEAFKRLGLPTARKANNMRNPRIRESRSSLRCCSGPRVFCCVLGSLIVWLATAGPPGQPALCDEAGASAKAAFGWEGVHLPEHMQRVVSGDAASPRMVGQ